MKIKARTVEGVRVLDCSGKITLGEGTVALRNSVHDALKEGSNKIVLNFGGVKYIDSSGIGELVHSHNEITGTGGQLRLLNLSKKLSDPLIITKLMTVFEAFEDEAGALASFH